MKTLKKTKSCGQRWVGCGNPQVMNKNRLSNQFSYLEELEDEYDQWQPHVGKRNRREHNDRQYKKKIKKFYPND